MHDRRIAFVTIILDGVGIGAQPDAHRYGDEDSHTLKHVCAESSPRLPHLERLGLGCIEALDGVAAVGEPAASYGKMQEVSAGKDSTTGHWELAGLQLDHPFPTYPDGFPKDVIDRFIALTDCRGVLGNKAASGTEIIDELGEEHARTGFPIVYTSADSVFQVAAHKEIISLDELYRLCEVARRDVCTGRHRVGRVIARPFAGESGAYRRISNERKDFSLLPPSVTIQKALQHEGVHTVAIGKIGELFAGEGFDEVVKTKSNDQGIDETLLRMDRLAGPIFIWTNLVDFDQEFGHRNDPEGFAQALEAFDARLPTFLDALPDGGILVITADHGNDPTTPSTDHSREFVPLLVCGAAAGLNLGVRRSFNDHAATAAAYFDIDFQTKGQPFEVFS